MVGQLEEISAVVKALVEKSAVLALGEQSAVLRPVLPGIVPGRGGSDLCAQDLATGQLLLYRQVCVYRRAYESVQGTVMYCPDCTSEERGYVENKSPHHRK